MVMMSALHGYRTLTALFLILFGFASAGWCDAIDSFTLTVSPTTGTTDDVFRLDVSIEGTTNAGFPYLKGGDDFTLTLLGPETSVEIINGERREKVVFHYRLLPKRSGTLRSPEAEIEHQGRRHHAPAVNVEVRTGSTRTGGDQKGVALKQEVSPARAFVGQQVVNTIELSTRIRLLQPQVGDLTFEQFWHEPIGDQESFRRMIGGTPHHVVQIRRAIFPRTHGVLTLEPREVKALVEEAPSMRAPFDPFRDLLGGGRRREITIRSNSALLAVDPLPAPPDDLPNWRTAHPLVGMVSLEASWEAGQVKTGEGKTIEWKLVTNGTLAALQEIPLPEIPHVQRYPEKPQVRQFENNGQLFTEKRFRYSLVPLTPGTIHLPSPRIGFFDPQTKSYRIAESSPITFSVEGPSLVPTPVPESAPAPSQIPPAEMSAFERFAAALTPSLALLLSTITISCVGGLFLLMWFLRRRSTERPLTRAIERATTVELLYQLLCQTLERRLSQAGVGGSVESVRLAVQGRITDPAKRYEILSLLDQFEEILFGGNQRNPEQLKELRRRVLQVVRS